MAGNVKELWDGLRIEGRNQEDSESVNSDSDLSPLSIQVLTFVTLSELESTEHGNRSE